MDSNNMDFLVDKSTKRAERRVTDFYAEKRHVNKEERTIHMQPANVKGSAKRKMQEMKRQLQEYYAVQGDPVITDDNS